MGVLTATIGGISLGLLVGIGVGAVRDRRRRREAELSDRS
jgi:uncharacterized protein involved in exopolysaccharide biosynthesis